MLNINWLLVFATGIIPLILGMIWYNPAVFGNAWMKAAGLSAENAKPIGMVKMIGFGLLLGIFIAFCLVPATIHQFHMGSIFANDKTMADPNSTISLYLADFYKTNGANFRTFGHGALHGFITAFLLSSAFVGMSAMFEQRSFKYVLIHVGYWVLTLSLMGGLICAFA